MVPGVSFSNGTGATLFQTLAPVPCFEWHRCHTFTKLALVAIFYIGTSATAFRTWHQWQFVKWHQYLVPTPTRPAVGRDLPKVA